MLGRATKKDPVWIASVAWKCSLLSVDIDRTRQMSSIFARMCGKRSLTIVPHLPPGLNCQRGLSSGVFDSDSPKTQLLGGEADAGVVYNGEAALAAREDPAFQYVLADDGCGIWFDNLAIPAGAPHPDVAHAFIDFMLEPEQSALITRDYPYSNPNTAGLEFLKTSLPDVYKAYVASAATNPSADAAAKCQPVKDVGAALPIYGDMWTQLKGGG